MARPNVPKFGNWENEDNTPYTVYFEKARQTRGTGKIINPNDPEENPDMFPNLAPPRAAAPQISKPKTLTEEPPIGRGGAARQTWDRRLSKDDGEFRQYANSQPVTRTWGGEVPMSHIINTGVDQVLVELADQVQQDLNIALINHHCIHITRPRLIMQEEVLHLLLGKKRIILMIVVTVLLEDHLKVLMLLLGGPKLSKRVLIEELQFQDLGSGTRMILNLLITTHTFSTRCVRKSKEIQQGHLLEHLTTHEGITLRKSQ
ncbi:hypothetical protein P3S68_007865 [Capsicum galapagoense]